MNDVILMPIVNETLIAHDIKHEVLACDPDMADTAAFCERYGFSIKQAANTILVASRKVEPVRYAVCVVLGSTRIDINKKVCQLMEVKRASFADAETTIRLTDMMIGGVTAIGIKGLPIYVDKAVMDQDKVVMGGGNRSSKIIIDPKELTKLPEVQIIEGLAS